MVVVRRRRTAATAAMFMVRVIQRVFATACHAPGRVHSTATAGITMSWCFARCQSDDRGLARGDTPVARGYNRLIACQRHAIVDGAAKIAPEG